MIVMLLQAPTNTPTPLPSPTPFFSGFGYVLFPTIEAPTVIPPASATPTQAIPPTVQLPYMEVYGYIGTLDAQSASLPSNITNPYVPIVPAVNAAALWGYAKWLISPSTADQIAGPFAPLIQHMAVIVIITLTLSLVYGLITAIRFVARFVVWMINRFLDFIPFFG